MSLLSGDRIVTRVGDCHVDSADRSTLAVARAQGLEIFKLPIVAPSACAEPIQQPNKMTTMVQRLRIIAMKP